MARPCEDLKTKFWRYVEMNLSKNQCWEWKGLRSSQNYGKISHRKKTLVAHRVSYKLFYGKLNTKKYVCHKCDNPPCVNPHHLFLGTHKDNVKDMISKGRRRDSRGEKNGSQCKMTNESILLMVEEISSKKISQNKASIKYGISQGVISGIMRGKRWSHITGIQKKKTTKFSAKVEAHGFCKLDIKSVKKIRRMYKSGKYTQKNLAETFKISSSTIYLVIKYLSWKDVKC